MALSMAQQYMKIDMQLMAAMGVKESNAGVGSYQPTNGSLVNGTMHWEDPSYLDVIYNPFPKFFPNGNGNGGGGGRDYINTPGYGDNTVGNSPQLGNVTFLSSLYMMYVYQMMYSSTSFDAALFFYEAKDKEIAGKLFAWAWNKGQNSSFVNVFTTPGAKDWEDLRDHSAIDYFKGVYHQIDEFDRMNRLAAQYGVTSAKYPDSYFSDSYIQSGDDWVQEYGSKDLYVERNEPVYVYDENISKKEVEEFFFGSNGDGSTGTLGSGGLLQHFDMTDAERITMWNDLSAAFDIMKGKAYDAGIATAEADKITFRYDWLAILRIGQQYLDLDIPIPNTEQFKNWVGTHSNDTVTSIKDQGIESIYPHLVNQGRTVANDTVVVRFSIKDETYLNISETPTVEWTSDSNFGGWKSATFVSGDTSAAIYEVRMPKAEVESITAATSPVTGWVRGYDRNYNAVIDTFSIYWDIPKEPGFDSAIVVDNNGDGEADKIELYLTKSNAPGADNLGDISNFTYSWPAKGSPVSESPIVNGAILTISSTAITGGTGEGEVTFDFPSKSGYKELLLDRVGPALVSAELHYSATSENDTVTALFTEPLENSFTSNHAYLNLIRGSGETATNSAQATLISDSVVQFIFPYGTFTAGDSASIVVDGGITDTLNNKPHQNNRRVPVKPVGVPTELTLDSAGAYDETGNGSIDYIEIFLTQGPATNADSINSVTNLLFSWPTDSLLTSGTMTVTDSSIILRDPSLVSGEGRGKVTLDSPSKNGIEGSVLDRIGPAITSAKLLYSENGDNDTVVITTSEPLGNALTDNSDYLQKHNGTSAVVTAKTTTKTTNTEYVLIFDYGTFSGTDSVSFNSASAIADGENNAPAQNNQRIPLTFVGGKKPSFKSGAIFDSNGDGIADSIVVTITLGINEPETMNDMDSLSYSWPNSSNASVSSYTVLDDTTVVITGISHPETAGNGSVTLFFPSGKIPGTLTDRVGPVVTEALLWEPQGGDDTLQVKFSEDITNLNDGDITVWIDGNTPQTIVAKKYLGNNVWLFTYPSGTVSLGDSTMISAVSPLKDMAGNSAHSNNRKVEIQIKTRPVQVASGSSLYDTNGDGTPDRLVLKLGSVVTQQRISSFELDFTWKNSAGSDQTFSLDSSAMNADGSDSVIVDLAALDLNSEMTSFEQPEYSAATLRQYDSDLPAGEKHEQTVSLEDKMAPILTGFASYHGKKLTEESAVFIDTLILTFSEEIQTISLGNGIDPTIFDLLLGSGIETIAITEESRLSNGAVSFAVQITSGSSAIPARDDSIRIAGNGQIVDAFGNGQYNETRPVPFKSINLPAEYSIAIYPTPFTPGTTDKNELLEYYGLPSAGLLAIMVRPFGDRSGEELQGWITLYDAVGNMIVEREELAKTDWGALLYTTDGTNSQGRQLGSGAYRGYIDVKSISDDVVQENQYPVMIGITK